MEDILYIENEVTLSIIENELKTLGIEYFIKKTDISTIPSNLQKNYIAILFSDIKNKKIILEINDNIKYEQNNAVDKNVNNNSTNKILNNILLLILFIIMLGIIIFQNIRYNDLLKSLNSNLNAYEYVYLSNGEIIEVYLKKENRLVTKYIDRNKNGINEKIESFLINGFIEIYEDLNEDGYFEKGKTYNGDELLMEYISTEDNGIWDTTFYYKNGQIENILYYDAENNKIWIE